MVEVNIVYKAVRTIVDLASTLMGHESLCPGNIAQINSTRHFAVTVHVNQNEAFELVHFVMLPADQDSPELS